MQNLAGMDADVEPSTLPNGHLLAMLGWALALGACGPDRGTGATMLPDPELPFVFAPVQSTVSEYELLIPEQTLQLFEADVDTPEQSAVFVVEGRRYAALVRLRGNSSREWPKKSWRVRLVDHELDGRDKINLISEWKDATFMVEKLGFDLLAAMHAPAPVATYVRLVINGRYQGVYLDTERVDKDFLEAHQFFDDDASIYRCGRKDCEMKPWRASFQTAWEKKTNERGGHADLDAILEAITFTPEPSLAEVLGERLELELYLRTMVVDALISNNVIEDSRSYFIHDRVSGRWIYVPWDLNNSVVRWTPSSSIGRAARVDRPLFTYSLTDSWVYEKYVYRTEAYPDIAWHPVSSNLNTRIAMNPALRQRLVVLLERALDELFDPEMVGARVAAIHALLRPHVADDPYVSLDKFDASPRYLTDYVARRREVIQREIARLTAAPTLVLAMVDPKHQRVALRNLGATPIALAGLALVTNVRAPYVPNLPASTLQPGERMELDAAALGLTLPDRGDLAVLDPARPTPFDVLFYGEVPGGRVLARSDTDPLRWELRQTR